MDGVIVINKPEGVSSHDVTAQMRRVFGTKKIGHTIQQALGLSARIKLVEPKTIERSMGKAVRVIDKRKFDN